MQGGTEGGGAPWAGLRLSFCTVSFLAGGKAGLRGEEGRRAMGGNDRRAGEMGGCVLGVHLAAFPSRGDVQPSNEKKEFRRRSELERQPSWQKNGF